MKNKLIFAGMLALMLVFGLITIGCDNGTTDEESSPFIGTWEQRNDIYKRIDKLIITETSWTWEINDENSTKGTYSYNGNTATFLETHEWDEDANKWEPIDEKDQEPFNFTISADGKNLNGKSYLLNKI
jgi:hypothetical protein